MAKPPSIRQALELMIVGFKSNVVRAAQSIDPVGTSGDTRDTRVVQTANYIRDQLDLLDVAYVALLRLDDFSWAAIASEIAADQFSIRSRQAVQQEYGRDVTDLIQKLRDFTPGERAVIIQVFEEQLGSEKGYYELTLPTRKEIDWY